MLYTENDILPASLWEKILNGHKNMYLEIKLWSYLAIIPEFNRSSLAEVSDFLQVPNVV